MYTSSHFTRRYVLLPGGSFWKGLLAPQHSQVKSSPLSSPRVVGSPCLSTSRSLYRPPFCLLSSLSFFLSQPTGYSVSFPDIVSSLSPQMAISSLLLGPPEAERGWSRWRETVCLPFLGNHSKEQPRSSCYENLEFVTLTEFWRTVVLKGREPTVNRINLSTIDKVASLYCSARENSNGSRLLILIAHYFQLFEIRNDCVHT